MEKYKFLKYTDFDTLYFEQLYNTALLNGIFEGKQAVDFLKLSDLQPVWDDFNLNPLECPKRDMELG